MIVMLPSVVSVGAGNNKHSASSLIVSERVRASVLRVREGEGRWRGGGRSGGGGEGKGKEE